MAIPIQLESDQKPTSTIVPVFMSILLPTSEAAFRRAEELFSTGDNTTGFMHLLLAARLADRPEALQLPVNLQPYAAELPRYASLLEELRSRAQRGRSSAYAPYSGYSVGSALLATDGTIWSGCNVESSSYGLTICAERTALVTAVANGKRRFAAVAVATQSSPPASPCGNCRQMLYEFAPDALVLMLNPEGGERWATLRLLLPDAFEAESLPEKGH